MRVTVLASDLAHNAMVRANLLAEILSRDFDVEMIGMRFGPAIWEPARGRSVSRVVPAARRPLFSARATQIRRAIRGDVVYAMKPLPSSLGIALRHRAMTGVPVVLDIEDDELSFRPATVNPLLAAWRMTDPNGRFWTTRTIARAREVTAITVASTGLQKEFGGTIVPHAKDTNTLRPGATDRRETRRGLGLDDERVVMFMGTPRPFKGIEDAGHAVRLMRHRCRYVVVGADAENPYVKSLMRELPDARFLPPYRLEETARWLDVADAVVVPSRLMPQTARQQPGKLLDAMAMAKPIVATRVADIPHMLGDDRGIVVPPQDPAALAMALDRIFDDPAAASKMGARARHWCVTHASYDAIRPVLSSIMHDVIGRLSRPDATVRSSPA